MIADQQIRSRIPPELMVAAGILLVSAVPSLLSGVMAAAEGSHDPVALIGGPVAAVALVAAGVETLRRCHFMFAMAVPAFLALLNLAYVNFSVAPIGFIRVLFWAVPAALILGKSRQFR